MGQCGKGMIAMCWKDKRAVLILSNMHDPTKQTPGPDKSENQKPSSTTIRA